MSTMSSFRGRRPVCRGVALRAGRRQGAVLLTVLLVLSAAGIMSFAAILAARDAVGTTDQRLAALEARWRAEGCAARAMAIVDAAVRASESEGVRSRWSSLDQVMDEAAASVHPHGCSFHVRAAGTGIDINQADRSTLGRLFRALGAPGAQADSMTEALLEWRDADRTSGAARGWYVSRGRVPPRHGPLADARELRMVRGFDALPAGLDSLLMESVEPGGPRLSLTHATPAALAALPGFGPEAVRRVLELRSSRQAHVREGGRTGVELVALRDMLSTQARGELAIHMPELARRTTAEPEGWRLLAIAEVPASAGSRHVRVGMELHLVRSGSGVAVTRSAVVR